MEKWEKRRIIFRYSLSLSLFLPFSFIFKGNLYLNKLRLPIRSDRRKPELVWVKIYAGSSRSPDLQIFGSGDPILPMREKPIFRGNIHVGKTDTNKV
jgi:hypothetical protein